ncbi:hypothetical protein ABT370_29075 [Streptomyces rubradiris]|uniref:hypothetical protein n=1 Tax=Streptomyces rubradiris TaxID=285531 RepID=UPI00332259DB
MAATAMLAVLGTIAGCSGSDAERGYAAPKYLCGVPVAPDLLSPFLPAGKTVKVRESRPVPSSEMFRVDVDGTRAVMAELHWWEEGVDVSTVVTANPETEKAARSVDDNFFYTATGAVKLAQGCKKSDHVRHLLYTAGPSQAG